MCIRDRDYGTEYLDYILSIKTVDSVDEAIAHINRYNTKHSECIVTENVQTAEKFLNEVDAACVYVNASTRFTEDVYKRQVLCDYQESIVHYLPALDKGINVVIQTFLNDFDGFFSVAFFIDCGGLVLQCFISVSYTHLIINLCTVF